LAVSFWDRKICHSFWKALVHENRDISANTTTMNLANGPIVMNRS